jgi:hypothetical protein
MRRTLLILATCLVAIVLVTGVATASSGRRVPAGLTNRSLKVVEAKLDADGIGFKTVGGGIFGIILKGDWGVCETIPAAGQVIHGPVKLIVAHYTCGVK